jgi:hypothetical protein
MFFNRKNEIRSSEDKLIVLINKKNLIIEEKKRNSDK